MRPTFSLVAPVLFMVLFHRGRVLSILTYPYGCYPDKTDPRYCRDTDCSFDCLPLQRKKCSAGHYPITCCGAYADLTWCYTNRCLTCNDMVDCLWNPTKVFDFEFHCGKCANAKDLHFEGCDTDAYCECVDPMWKGLRTCKIGDNECRCKYFPPYVACAEPVIAACNNQEAKKHLADNKATIAEWCGDQEPADPTPPPPSHTLCRDEETKFRTCLGSTFKAFSCLGCVLDPWPDDPKLCSQIDRQSCTGIANCASCEGCEADVESYLECSTKCILDCGITQRKHGLKHVLSAHKEAAIDQSGFQSLASLAAFSEEAHHLRRKLSFVGASHGDALAEIH